MTLSERSVRREKGGSVARSRWRSRPGADEVDHDAADVLSTNLIALAATLMYPPPLTDGKLRLPRQLDGARSCPLDRFSSSSLAQR
jgi:hypothetical protein